MADDSYQAQCAAELWLSASPEIVRTSMIEPFIVFLGAGLGGMLRHGINLAALRVIGQGFPYATMVINITGSIVMGLLVGYFATTNDPGPAWRLFLTTGMLGGFTTFSTFSLEAVMLYQRGQFLGSAVYIAASVVLALTGLMAGLALMRALR